MTRGLWILLFLAVGCDAQVTPRSGWVLVPGAEDLIQAGNWGCVAGVAAGGSSLTVTASAGGYNTVINTAGPLLQVTGDFSVLAQMAGTGFERRGDADAGGGAGGSGVVERFEAA